MKSTSIKVTKTYEISWDGKNVWVNEASCVARFSFDAGEIYTSNTCGNVVVKEGFENWKSRVRDTFGIIIPDESCPSC